MIVGQLFGVWLHSIDTPWHSIDKNIFLLYSFQIFLYILFLSDLNYEDSRSLIINHIVISE